MAALALCGGLAAPVAAQDPVAEADSAQDNQALRVFFDCQGGGRGGGLCDFNFYRREIPFVNYTRDRTDAQVHLLITREGTGAGGQLYTLDFIGREDFVGIDDRLTVGTIPNEADEQSMTRIAASVRLGLLRYIARTDQASDIQVIYELTEAGDAGNVARPEDDKWDFWTFRVRMNGGLNVDARTESYRINGGLSANRITDDLKLEFSVGGNYNESSFEVNDSTTVTSIREGYDFEGLNVWSLNDRWSFGVNYETGRSTFGNYDLRIEGGPAIEYNIFPYRESTRRQLSFLYTVGVRHYQYIEETIFLLTEETRPRHELSAGLSIRQPWGGAYGSLEFSQYLHDLEKNRLEVRLGADFRLFRGLSLNFNTNYQRIRDQLNVPAGDATEEEVLLRQRILLSGFEYSFSVGFSYTFGSIFTNVVNPRMERF
jgi:hypothetical protein